VPGDVVDRDALVAPTDEQLRRRVENALRSVVRHADIPPDPISPLTL
jgi:hypothetical protein